MSCNVCGSVSHSNVRCPALGEMICMEHCSRCRWRIADGISSQWCRYYPDNKNGGEELGSSEKGRG